MQGFDSADVVTSALSVVAVIVAAIALMLARRQVSLADQQLVMAKRQELIALKQHEIAEAQQKVIEEQHAFFKEQQSRKSDLRVIVDGSDSQIKGMLGSQILMTSTIRFSVHNGGNKSADPFYWELLIPEDLSPQIRFVNENGQEHNGEISHQSATESYRKTEDHYVHRLPAFSGVKIGKVTFSPENQALATFVLKWRIRCAEEMIPEQGLAFLKFKRMPDNTYVWTRWHPGQKEEDIADTLVALGDQ